MPGYPRPSSEVGADAVVLHVRICAEATREGGPYRDLMTKKSLRSFS